MDQLLAIADKGSRLVAATTKYLSTLPQQIEVLEELVSVASVTSSLLASLSDELVRFPTLFSSPTVPFIAPLCADIARAFSELEMKVEDARVMKVFETNDVGLVRAPRFAWCAVCGGEREAARLRSRLYVEKYRVRVLLDAVCWEGLRKKEGRSVEEEKEFEGLRNMLPLLTERLVNVQNDYNLKLKDKTAPETVAVVPFKPVEVVKEKVEQDVDRDLKKSSKISIHSLSSSTTVASTSSASSSITAINDVHHELWVLRRNEVKRSLASRLYLFGIPFYTSHNYEAASYYLKAVASSHDEVTSYLALSPPLSKLKNKILKMDEDAQWEIQRLCEVRAKASCTEKVTRDWNVVGLAERPRRKIASEGGKWWKRGKGKNERVEWVLVLRGETVDHRSRVAPSKHEDPWNPKPKARPVVVPLQQPKPQLQLQPQPQRMMCPAHVQGNVVRRVPERVRLSVQEAEVKMEGILADLFNPAE